MPGPYYVPYVWTYDSTHPGTIAAIAAGKCRYCAGPNNICPECARCTVANVGYHPPDKGDHACGHSVLCVTINPAFT